MKKKYMNPYLAGTLLGIVLLLAMYLSGRGLGASGGLKYCVVSVVGAVDRPHAEQSVFYSKYFEGGKKPLKNWLTGPGGLLSLKKSSLRFPKTS